MVRIGGFLKTQNRIRRQHARGRFISPYQVGDTIFGKSTMARYPLMHTSSRLLEPWRLTHLKQRRKVKGGTNAPSVDDLQNLPDTWLRTMARRRHSIKTTRR